MATRKPNKNVGKKDNDDLQLMLQLGTFDDCEGYAITDADQVEGNVPPWAEVAFTITREGKQLVHYLTRHDGEAIILALLRVLHPNAGKGVSAQLWAGVDEAMIGLMEGDLTPEDRLKTQGVALGLSTALAVIRSPHAPDLDAIRREARERYEAAE